MARQDTRDKIIAIAQDLLADQGLEHVSFDAIAQRLGRSKQAVLYWFPSKPDLLAALFLPALTAEAHAVESALAPVSGQTDSIAAFVQALVAFHTGNLSRFRMMYLAPQLTKGSIAAPSGMTMLEQVHAITDRTYAALASRLDDDPVLARQRAVAIHAAVLGLCTMMGLASQLNDPLKHGEDRLVNALIASLTQA